MTTTHDQNQLWLLEQRMLILGSKSFKIIQTNIDILMHFFFHLTDFPYLLTKKLISPFHNRRCCSPCIFIQPEYQTCHHDQIFLELEHSSWFKKSQAVC